MTHIQQGFTYHRSNTRLKSGKSRQMDKDTNLILKVKVLAVVKSLKRENWPMFKEEKKNGEKM